MSNYRKISFLVVMVFCLTLISFVATPVWASEFPTVELTKGKASYNVSKYEFGNSSYLKVDDFSILMDTSYQVNPNGSVLLGEGGTFIMGNIGSLSPVTIRKEQLQTMYSDQDPIFVTDAGTLFVQSDIAIGVFTNNIVDDEKTTYSLDGDKSLKFFYNGSEKTYDDYILIADIVYVDMNSFLEAFESKNGRHTDLSGWLRITDKNYNYQYMIKQNSSRDIELKSNYIEEDIAAYHDTYAYTKVEGKDYLDLKYAAIGNFLSVEDNVINIYDLEYIKSQLAIKHRVKNIQEVISYISGLENFESSNRFQVYLKEGQGQYEKAGKLSISYGSDTDGVSINMESIDDGNAKSPFYNNDLDVKLYVDKNEKSLYTVNEDGEKELDSEKIDKSLANVLQSIQFENSFYISFLNRVFDSVPAGESEEAEIYNDDVMKILSGVANDSMFKQEDEDYSYRFNLSNLLYALKKEKLEGNRLAGPMYEAMSLLKETTSYNFSIDLDFDEDNKKLTNISGEFIVEQKEDEKKAIKVVFRSYIKHNK